MNKFKLTVETTNGRIHEIEFEDNLTLDEHQNKIEKMILETPCLKLVKKSQISTILTSQINSFKVSFVTANKRMKPKKSDLGL